MIVKGLQLSRWEIDQDDIGAFFKTSEDDFLSIRRYIEVADEKLSAEVGQLTPLSRYQID